MLNPSGQFGGSLMPRRSSALLLPALAGWLVLAVVDIEAAVTGRGAPLQPPFNVLVVGLVMTATVCGSVLVLVGEFRGRHDRNVARIDSLAQRVEDLTVEVGNSTRALAAAVERIEAGAAALESGQWSGYAAGVVDAFGGPEAVPPPTPSDRSSDTKPFMHGRARGGLHVPLGS